MANIEGMSEETLDRLAEGERRFNTIQAGLRALASTWVLAAFAGIATLLRQTSEFTWLLSPFHLAILVCIMATIGLTSLWVIDQLVIHRLLNSIFLVGMKIEHDLSHVPPVRAMMAESSEGKGMSYLLRLFYVAPMTGFALISLAMALIAYLLPEVSSNSVMVPQWLVWIAAMFPLGPLFWVMLRSEDVPFHVRAHLFADEKFTEIVKERKYGDIIRRFTADRKIGEADRAS